MKEADLFFPVKQFLIEQFDCSKVYGEILDLDVLGVYDNNIATIGVELKTRLNFKLLSQALERQHLVDYMYICAPYPKYRLETFLYDFCKSNKIGILLVRESGDVNVILKADYNRTRRKLLEQGKRDIRDSITDYSEQNIGGVPSGQVMTAYKRTIQQVQRYLELQKQVDLSFGKTELGYARTSFLKNRDGDLVLHEGKPIKQTFYVRNAGDVSITNLLNNVNTHYAHPKQSLMATLREAWNQDWCEINKYDNTIYYRIRDSEDGTL